MRGEAFGIGAGTSTATSTVFDDLVARSALLATALASGAAAVGVHAAGVDDDELARVGVDGSGLVHVVHVSRRTRWATAEEVGAAVVAATDAAEEARLRHAVEATDAHIGDPDARRVPAVRRLAAVPAPLDGPTPTPRGPVREVLALLGRLQECIETATEGRLGVLQQAVASRCSTSGAVVATASSGGLTHVAIDESWFETAAAGSVGREVATACRAAQEASSGPTSSAVERVRQLAGEVRRGAPVSAGPVSSASDARA
jgi:hypothetical protein